MILQLGLQCSDGQELKQARVSLQGTLDALKDDVASVENELVDLQEVEKRQKTLVEGYRTQVTCICFNDG